jgi:uncharacterized protein YjbJ (UPF0337 family)
MGAVETLKGKAKQAVGDIADDEKLRSEGEAQEAKGEHETKESKARAEAKAHEEKAEYYEAKQEAAER